MADVGAMIAKLLMVVVGLLVLLLAIPVAIFISLVYPAAGDGSYARRAWLRFRLVTSRLLDVALSALDQS